VKAYGEGEMNPKTFDVIIVGAGLAGLSCAHRIQAQGAEYLLIEASDRVGGRVKTDVVKGFNLNHGFQVLQTAYPEAQRFLDYAALDLKAFAPGAVFRIGGRFHTVADPLRAPRYVIQTLAAPIGTWGDRLRMARLNRRLTRAGPEEILRASDIPTPKFLKREGFSELMIKRFFKPFFSGVCLDPEIQVSSRAFRYIFRLREPFLVVNAEGRGPINNLCVPSQVAPTYAPKGRSLVSVTVIGEQTKSKEVLEHAVKDQLGDWYGRSVRRWDLLRTYSIRHALPDQPAPAPDPTRAVGELRPGIFVCGEYGSLPSVQWALLSGRLAAEAILAALLQRKNL
jgi:hypothetical protein